MKSETFYRMSPTDRSHLTREKAREIIADYVNWYNCERIQKFLGYRLRNNTKALLDAGI